MGFWEGIPGWEGGIEFPEQLWMPLDLWNVRGQAGHWGLGHPGTVGAQIRSRKFGCEYRQKSLCNKKSERKEGKKEGRVSCCPTID